MKPESHKKPPQPPPATVSSAPAVVLVRVGADGRIGWLSAGAAALGCDALTLGRPLREAFADPGQVDALLACLASAPVDGERLDLRGAGGGSVPVVLTGAPGEEPTIALTPAPVEFVVEGSRRATDRDGFTRGVLDSLFTFVGLLELDGTLVDVNRAPLQIADLSADDVLGRKFWDTPWWSYSAEVQARLRVDCERAARGEVVRYDAVVRTRGDARMTIDFQLAPLRDEGGRVARLIPSAIDVTERRRTEEALRESELFYRQTLDHMPGLVFTNTPDGRCDFVSRPWVEFTGVPADAHLGDGWVQVLHPDDRQGAFAAWRDAVDGRGRYDLKYRVRRRDGAYEWFKVRGRPIRDEAGRIVRWLGTALSVEDLERAEDALREREERYRLVGRATNDVMWDWDLRTDRLEWNDAMQVQTGWTLDELGPRIEGWSDRIHPDDHERVVAGVHAAIDAGREGWSDEYRFRRRDGSYATVLDRGYIARDASGEAVRMIGSMLDLTERRAVEAALQESEARFRALADNMSQFAWMCDASGDLFWYNQRWFDYTGTTLEDMQGWGWTRVHHPEHVERVVEKFRRCLQSGEPWEDTFPLRGEDGQYRWFLSRALPIRDGSGEVLRWFGTNTDVTAQREAEEALREAGRRKDEFLAMLAHELRNPLAPVRFAVQMLRLVGPQEPALTRARDVIDRQVAHMARLIDDLLDVSRIARGRVQLQRERCDLGQIVRQTTEDYRANLEAGGLRLALHAPPAPVWVDGDRTRLVQMIGNLLHNGGKFTGPGGRVTVSVAVDSAARAVTVRVEDTGVGMEPALLARLFDTFSQADQGIDRSKGGLGLGLALVKGLVELHGGTVSARSAGPGQGSTFELRLPTLEAVPRDLAADAADGARRVGLRVLVIEDNRDAASSLVELLAVTGFQPDLALDGRTGIDKARATAPEVVICDLGLPGGMDGCAVARALRADPTTASCFLVALSGYGQVEDRLRTKDAGFDLHLVKPVDWSVLEGALATWAGGSR